VSSYICDRPLEPDLWVPGTLVRASVGITDEAGTSAVHVLRESQRILLTRKVIGRRLFSLPCRHSLSAKVAVAAHHIHLDTLPTLPSNSGILGHPELA